MLRQLCEMRHWRTGDVGVELQERIFPGWLVSTSLRTWWSTEGWYLEEKVLEGVSEWGGNPDSGLSLWSSDKLTSSFTAARNKADQQRTAVALETAKTHKPAAQRHAGKLQVFTGSSNRQTELSLVKGHMLGIKLCVLSFKKWLKRCHWFCSQLQFPEGTAITNHSHG